MAYEVVLLDDEPLILESLQKVIPWEELECILVGTAQNGAAGKELIDRTSPDIVITDIEMPGLNGIGIAGYCEKHPGCRVIIISAHRDFSYARQAMSYGVMYYVLKPISIDELTDAIRKAVKDIEADREKGVWADSENRAHTEQLAASSLLFHIARYGQENRLEEERRLTYTKNVCPGVVAAVRFYNVDIGTYGKEELLLSGKDYYNTLLKSGGYTAVWGSSEEMLVLLCQVNPGIAPAAARRRLLQLLGQGTEEISPAFGIVVVSVSDVYSGVTGLHDAYLTCMQRSRQGFFSRESAVISTDKDMETQYEEPDTEELLAGLLHGNQEQYRLAINKWKRQVVQCGEREEVLYQIRELYRKATLAATQIGMKEKPKIHPDSLWENCRSMLKHLEDYLDTICLYAKENQNLEGRMRLLIQQNYTDSTLNLNLLAEQLHVNPAYLSRMFKKNFGENFSGYLLNLRLERACTLLRTSRLRIGDIAHQSGFEDEHYFSQVFKKKYGITPKIYREQHNFEK